eukprot:3430666-Prymnesium_polylepis.2
MDMDIVCSCGHSSRVLAGPVSRRHLGGDDALRGDPRGHLQEELHRGHRGDADLWLALVSRRLASAGGTGFRQVTQASEQWCVPRLEYVRMWGGVNKQGVDLSSSDQKSRKRRRGCVSEREDETEMVMDGEMTDVPVAHKSTHYSWSGGGYTLGPVCSPETRINRRGFSASHHRHSGKGGDVVSSPRWLDSQKICRFF